MCCFSLSTAVSGVLLCGLCFPRLSLPVNEPCWLFLSAWSTYDSPTERAHRIIFFADPLFLSVNVERKHPLYLSPFGDKLVFSVTDGFGTLLLYIATSEVFLSRIPSRSKMTETAPFSSPSKFCCTRSDILCSQLAPPSWKASSSQIRKCIPFL